MSFFRRLHANSVATGARTERGFTLIELMVVVLIIAVLIAIAIPTFLGSRTRSQDRAAQSELRNALTAEKVLYTDNQTFDNTTAKLKTLEPSLNWNGAGVGHPALNVSVGTTVNAQDTLCLSETSKSGTVWNLAEIATGTSGGIYQNKGGSCSTTAATLTSGAWNTGW